MCYNKERAKEHINIKNMRYKTERAVRAIHTSLSFSHKRKKNHEFDQRWHKKLAESPSKT